MEWKDKVVVIVGTENAVGLNLIASLNAESAEVYSCMRNLKVEELDQWIKRIGESRGHIDTMFCDVRISKTHVCASELPQDIIKEKLKDTVYYAWKSALFSVPYLKKAEHGSIVFITDNDLRHQKKDNVLSSICSTSIESITKNLASEVASSGIRVCSIAVDIKASDTDGAKCAAFLASQEASYITGTMIEVTGSTVGQAEGRR